MKRGIPVAPCLLIGLTAKPLDRIKGKERWFGRRVGFGTKLHRVRDVVSVVFLLGRETRFFEIGAERDL